MLNIAAENKKEKDKSDAELASASLWNKRNLMDKKKVADEMTCMAQHLRDACLASQEAAAYETRRHNQQNMGAKKEERNAPSAPPHCDVGGQAL